MFNISFIFLFGTEYNDQSQYLFKLVLILSNTPPSALLPIKDIDVLLLLVTAQLYNSLFSVFLFCCNLLKNSLCGSINIPLKPK